MKLIYHVDSIDASQHLSVGAFPVFYYPESWPAILSPRKLFDWTQALLTTDHSNIVIVTYSETILYAVRLAVKRGLASTDDVEIVFINKESTVKIPIDCCGKLYLQPRGFCDYNDNWLLESL